MSVLYILIECFKMYGIRHGGVTTESKMKTKKKLQYTKQNIIHTYRV